MEKIIILDYVKGVTYVRDFDQTKITAEDLIDSLGLNSGDCEWMISDTFKLNMQ